MKQYDITLLDNLFPVMQRGKLRKAKRMMGMLISRAETPEDLVEIVKFIGYETRRYHTWTKDRWRNFDKVPMILGR